MDVTNKRLKLNTLMTRAALLGGSIGDSFGGARSLYEETGWIKNPTYQDYKDLYDRLGIATRVVTSGPDATWARGFRIVAAPDTVPLKIKRFNTAWDNLVTNRKVYSYLNRVDRLAGIGRFAVLLMGFDDNAEDLSVPVSKAARLLYLSCYSEPNAQIATIDRDKNSPRYNLPETYNLTVQDESGLPASEKQPLVVHHSRVLHIAEGLADNEILGTPRLQSVLNPLTDIEKITGSSAEMFYKAAYGGMSFTMDPEADPSEDDLDALNDQIVDYLHGLRRDLVMQGVTPNPLNQDLTGPLEHFNTQINMISGAKGIPRRILLGSEQGEMASTQDDAHWQGTIDRRRRLFAEPDIARAFIDKLMQVGVLPALEQYEIVWPDLFAVSATLEAEIANKKTAALAAYMNSRAFVIMDPEDYFRNILTLSEEEIKDIKSRRNFKEALAAHEEATKTPKKTAPDTTTKADQPVDNELDTTLKEAQIDAAKTQADLNVAKTVLAIRGE